LTVFCLISKKVLSKGKKDSLENCESKIHIFSHPLKITAINTNIYEGEENVAYD
jgi:hypothetical protein